MKFKLTILGSLLLVFLFLVYNPVIKDRLMATVKNTIRNDRTYDNSSDNQGGLTTDLNPLSISS